MVICCKGRGGFKTFAKGVITLFHDFKQIKYQVVFCSKTFEFQNVFSPSLLTPSLIPVQQVFQKQKLNNLLFVAAFLEHPSTQECYYAMLAHMLMLAIPTLVSVSEGFRKNNVAPLVCSFRHYQGRHQWKKTFSFGHCPNDGGGVYPNFLTLFLEVHFWSIKRVDFFKNANVLNF